MREMFADRRQEAWAVVNSSGKKEEAVLCVMCNGATCELP